MGNRCFSLGRYENVCNIGQCVSQVQLQPRLDNPFETFVLTVNALYLRQKIDHVTCQVMASSPDSSFDYGILVYANIVEMLYVHNVCPFFRRFYGAAYNCSAANVAFMLQGRPGVTYNLRLLESFDATWTKTAADSLRLLIRRRKLVKFYEILFQVAVAAYALECADTFHNNFTAQNIAVCLLDKPQAFNIQVEDMQFFMTSKYKVVVHGFDDSCSLLLGMNTKLNNPGNPNPNQKNEGVFFQDFITFLGRVFVLFKNDVLQNELLEVMSN
jgi:hypothetical protein